jgi:hypothetical protein
VDLFFFFDVSTFAAGAHVYAGRTWTAIRSDVALRNRVRAALRPLAAARALGFRRRLRGGLRRLCRGTAESEHVSHAILAFI